MSKIRREAGKRVAAELRAKDPEHYIKMGRLGGQTAKAENRYFYKNREGARRAGSIGGKISRRPKGGQA